MWLRLWRISPLALLIVLGSCSGGIGDKKADDPGSGAALSESNDKPNPNGPGLRGTSTDSLKLPVPRAFDLSHVESRYFAAALGKDPTRLFEFVRDRIAFEPYLGSLRGPRGTLMAMAGNSVDRAALLGSLLTSSGHQVRFAHGKLKASIAEDLVASLWAERPSAPEAPASSTEPEVNLRWLLDGVDRDAKLIANTLGKAGVPAKRPPSLTRDRLVKEAQDHYWVEWMQDGQWTALDPSFATSAPGQRYAEPEATFDALPEDLFHHVTVKVRAEEYRDGQPASRELLDYSARAADLSGIDVFLSHQRDQSDQGVQLRPVLTVGQDQVVGLAYLVAASAAPAKPSGALADALAGDAESETLPIASALFVELELVAPDGGKDTVVREIFDRVGKQRRMAQSKLTAGDLATAANAPTRPERLPGAVYDFFVTTGAVHKDHLHNVSSLSAAPDKQLTIGGALRMLNVAFAAVSDGLTGRMTDSTGRVLRTYPDAPRIYVAELSDRNGMQRLSLDLRRDRPRVSVSGFDGQRLFMAQVLRGVIAGALEREVLGFFARSDPSSTIRWAPGISTNRVFERAQAAKIDPVFLSGNSSSLSKDIAADARARVEESLAAGQLVVAPKRAVDLDGAQRFAWWSIDASSGATMAVTDEGLHQNTAEGVVVRNPSGEFVLEVRAPGQAFEQYHAANAEQAAHWVKNITSNYQNLHQLTIEWQGMEQIWNILLAGL